MDRVRKTPAARRDLVEIGKYIARQCGSRHTAENYLRKLAAKLDLLATQPLMGQERPEFATGAYRCFPVDNYVIYYTPSTNGIVVARVLHGAREHDAIL